MQLTFDIGLYDIVRLKETNDFYAALKSDTPFGKWKEMKDLEVSCFAINKDGSLDKSRVFKYKRGILNPTLIPS